MQFRRRSSQIQAILTGDDAISFFARNSASSRLKIVYCNRVPSSPIEFKPYDMLVVPQEKIDPEYLRRHGQSIVKASPGFTPKDRFGGREGGAWSWWEREGHQGTTSTQSMRRVCG